MELASVYMLAKVVLSFVLFFVVFPSPLIQYEKEDSTLLDRLFIPLVHSSVYLVIIVHLLTVTQLFESFSILVIGAASWLFFMRKRQINLLGDPGTKTLVKIFDIAEGWHALIQQVVSWRDGLKRSYRSRVDQTLSVIKRNWLSFSLIVVSLAYAAYMRFYFSLHHYFFAATDPYVHMKWAKFVQKNILFVDGVYPYGYEVILAGLSRFFFIDMYDLIRFMGPIASMLIILSVFYAVNRLGYNLYAAFAAMFAFAFLALLPTDLWRQINALSMEYAAIFLLPGIAFWLSYCRSGKQRELLLAAECLFLTVIIHPFTAVCYGIAITAIGIIYLPSLWHRSRLKETVLYFGSASLAGVLPIGLAVALGKHLHGTSVSYLRRQTGVGQSDKVFSIGDVMGTLTAIQIWSGVAVAIGVALIFSWYLLKRKSLIQGPVGLPTALVLLIIFLAFYYADLLGIPKLIPADRFGIYMALVAAFAIGIGISVIGRVMESNMARRYLTGTLGIVTAAAIAWSGDVVAMPTPQQYQYDEAAETYLTVKNRYDAANWTIVSPVEEYPMVEAFGYHSNLWEFVRAISPDTEEQIGFPTGHVFLFVETIPLNENKPISADDALQPFPEPKGDNLTDYYYRSENRRILEAKVYNWAEWYRKRYPARMSLLVDKPHFKVYHLEQQAKTPAPLLPKLPKDRVGVW